MKGVQKQSLLSSITISMESTRYFCLNFPLSNLFIIYFLQMWKKPRQNILGGLNFFILADLEVRTYLHSIGGNHYGKGLKSIKLITKQDMVDTRKLTSSLVSRRKQALQLQILQQNGHFLPISSFGMRGYLQVVIRQVFHASRKIIQHKTTVKELAHSNLYYRNLDLKYMKLYRHQQELMQK